MSSSEEFLGTLRISICTEELVCAGDISLSIDRVMDVLPVRNVCYIYWNIC